MYLNKLDVKKILDIMDEFPDAQRYKLSSDSSSGIGTTITLTVSTKINNKDAAVVFEISGIENW